MEGGRRRIAVILHYLLEILVPALLIVLFLFVFGGRILAIEGRSMLPGLEEGDYVLVSGLFYSPGPGDVVVLRQKSFMDAPLVKRIIAVEGQMVDIDFDQGLVYVDGRALEEPYLRGKTNAAMDLLFPREVEKGCVFVLGDNRNESTDSRDSRVGMVDSRCIIGRVLCIVAPLQRMGGIQ